MERAKGLISDFCRSEYDSEADFSDPTKIGVAYTTVTDDEIPIPDVYKRQGKEDMPDDAERKGIGTPATRSGIIEKLVSSGFVERRKSKKITNLLPTSTGCLLYTSRCV